MLVTIFMFIERGAHKHNLYEKAKQSIKNIQT